MKKHSHFFIPVFWTRDPWTLQNAAYPPDKKGTPVLGYNEEDLTSEFQWHLPPLRPQRLQKCWQSSLHVDKQHSPGLHNVCITHLGDYAYVFFLPCSFWSKRLQMVPGLGLTHPHWDNSCFSLEKGLWGCLLVCFLINCWFVYPTGKLQPTFSSVTTQHTHLQPNHCTSESANSL